jgi:hypothetical protein
MYKIVLLIGAYDMKYVKVSAVACMIFLLTACGRNLSSSTTPAAGAGSSATVSSVEGVAAKGLIAGGTVKVYAVTAAGVKGQLLSESTTGDGSAGALGHYKVDLGSYAGAVLVEVTGGSYEDEATHKTIQNSATVPLRALYPDVAPGTTTLQVTPLTELAAVRVGTTMTPAAIRAANTLVSEVMKVDILSTAPVAPTVAGFTAPGVTQAQRDYALMLAAVSQLMATTGATLDAALSSLNSGISSTGMADNSLSVALSTFVSANTVKTGVTTVPPALQNLGTVTKKITVSLTGSNTSAIQALTTVLTLPAGLLVPADAAGVPSASVVTLAGSAASAKNIYVTSKYIAAAGASPASLTISLITPEGGLTAGGDILAVICDVSVAAGSTVPAASAITNKTDFKDANGALLVGPTLSVY